MKKILKDNMFYIVIFLIVYCVMQFVGTAGPYTSGDAGQYIGMGGALPPFYPLFLAAFRSVFGKGIYLEVVVVVQSLFAAFSITLIASFLHKNFKLTNWYTVLIVILLMIPFVRESMRDEPRYMISHWILTEGMGLSIFYCYSWFGLRTIYHKSIKPFIGLSVCTFILLLVRAQFLVCIPLNLLVIIYLLWQSKGKRVKILVLSLAMVAISYLLSGVVEDQYKIARTGTTKNAWNSSYFLQHLIYSSDAEDVDIFETVEQQELFTILYQQFDEEEYLYPYAQGSMFEKGWHWCYNFSQNYRDMKATIAKYVAEKGITDSVEQGEYIAKIVSDMVAPLMKANGLRCIGYSLYQFPTSMTYYVFILKESHLTFSFVMAALIYILTIAVLLIRFIQNKQCPSIWMMLFMLAFMIGNALVSDFALHTMVRYMLYAMGLFYALLGTIIWQCIKERGNKVNE